MTTNMEKQIIRLTNQGFGPGVIALTMNMAETKVRQVQKKLRKEGLLPK